MFRWLAALVLIVLLAYGAAYFVAGRGAPPDLRIDKPAHAVGQSGTLEVTAGAPNGRFAALDIAAEQNGKRVPLFSLVGGQPATMTAIDRDHVRITRPFGKQSIPELQSGPARVIVTATRPS